MFFINRIIVIFLSSFLFLSSSFSTFANPLLSLSTIYTIGRTALNVLGIVSETIFVFDYGMYIWDSLSDSDKEYFEANTTYDGESFSVTDEYIDKVSTYVKKDNNWKFTHIAKGQPVQIFPHRVDKWSDITESDYNSNKKNVNFYGTDISYYLKLQSLGGGSFKFQIWFSLDGGSVNKWSSTTVNHLDPLTDFYIRCTEENSGKGLARLEAYNTYGYFTVIHGNGILIDDSCRYCPHKDFDPGYIPKPGDDFIKDVLDKYPNVNNDLDKPVEPPVDPPVEPPVDPDLPVLDLEGINLKPLTNLFETLGNKFPFSIPSDILSIINIFDVEPSAPIFEVPFITETLTIDLTQFDLWANIIRLFMYLGFLTSLLFLTRKIGG